MEIKIGCDPEVFVRQHGTFKSAHGLIKGDKKNPHPVRSGAVQVDGMALEFNIDPASSEDAFAYNVQDVFNQLKLMVPDYEIVTVPVAHFDEQYMKAQPSEALELGCDPDFDAWNNGVAFVKPNALRPMRTASGHVHIGWTDEGDASMDEAIEVSKQMDFYLGLGSLAYDTDTERREMYGKAGCFRPKKYGVEYRTLSNAWLRSEKLMRWVFRNAKKGMLDLIDGKLLSQKYGDISDIINTSNKKEAMKILKAEKIEVCHG